MLCLCNIVRKTHDVLAGGSLHMAYLSYLYIIFGRGQAGEREVSSLSRWQCLRKEVGCGCLAEMHALVHCAWSSRT